MPMELLFSLAQSPLPVTIDKPCDIDKLRVIAAAQLVEARLPEVGAAEQTAEVLAISAQGRAALVKAYPHHDFHFGPAVLASAVGRSDWPASDGSYRLERDTGKTTLDS
ncbi:MAG: hypothetical protein LWW96_19120 [Acidovorax sp.]|uniref:hypothetical protein n=1 Tax=Acidovorax sp. TaxID=1872122 RepID=UPI0025C64D19|nr:hypothetical protein [Acidovorax sp.]MCE1194262.1 hypothetical protein [Acidovorax sp.]